LKIFELGGMNKLVPVNLGLALPLQPIMPPRDIWPVELGPIMPGPRPWDAGRAAIGDVTISAAKTTVDKAAVNGSLY
jgi:hypothetical protein